MVYRIMVENSIKDAFRGCLSVMGEEKANI